MSSENTPSSGHRTYTNVVLTVIAGLLAAALVGQAAGGLGATAVAQPQTVVAGGPSGDEPPGAPIFNAAEQRRQMIAELRVMNQRLEKVETMLTRGLSVKVTEMPAPKADDKK